MGGALPFMVISTAPKGVVQIQDDTIIEMKEEPVREGEVLTPTVTYEDIGGLKEELMKVREMIELPLKHAELFERRDRSAERSPPVRAARHRQDAHREGGGERSGREFLFDPRPGDHVEVLRPKRGAPPREVRGGPEERSERPVHR